MTDTTNNTTLAWDKAAARYTAAAAQAMAKDQTDEQLDEAIDEQVASVRALIAMRAPNAPAIAFKARAVLEEQARYADEDHDQPEVIAMLLSSPDPYEALAASIYQDGLAMAGASQAVASVAPSHFEARKWLARLEAATRSRLIYNPGHGRAYSFHGGNHAAAEASFAALASREREWVELWLPRPE